MQLTSILVIIVTVLTLLVGVTVLFGTKADKDTKLLSVKFACAALGATLWAGSIILFLNLSPDATAIAPFVVSTIYISGMMMVVAVFSYVAQFTGYKIGRILTMIFVGAGVILSVLIVVAPQLLYSEIKLNSEVGNEVLLRAEWLYITYVVFFAVMMSCYGVFLFIKILSRPAVKVRNICILLLIGFGTCGFISMCFDLLLPLQRYDLIWIGPLSVAISIISFYYAILRYRMISVLVDWMKIMSYVVMIAMMSLAYVVLLFVLSIALLKRAYIPVADLILNFAMITVVFAMVPALSELMTNVRSLLSMNAIDISYIAKRLKRFSLGKIKLKELTVFLAEHLHFSYVGIVVDNKLYGSKDVVFTVKDIEIGAIENKNAPDQVWEVLKNGGGDRILEFEDLRAIVDLKDMDGVAFGKIVFGASYQGAEFDEEDALQLEMMIGLVAMAINPRKGKN